MKKIKCSCGKTIKLNYEYCGTITKDDGEFNYWKCGKCGQGFTEKKNKDISVESFSYIPFSAPEEVVNIIYKQHKENEEMNRLNWFKIDGKWANIIIDHEMLYINGNRVKINN